MKGKGTWKWWLCISLTLTLFVIMSEAAFASQKPEWRYGNSILARVLVEETRSFSPEDFPGINCKKVFVLGKHKIESESKVSYKLVLMLEDNANVKDAVEKVKQLPMVVEAERNEEYVMKDTILTLNRSYLYLPVGESENIWVSNVNLGRRWYSIYGIRFGLDPAYSEQISIEKGCFAKYGISCFGAEIRIGDSGYMVYPFIPEELESQKSESGMYHGLAGDKNEYLFDSVARLAASPEIDYVTILREFAVGGEESYNAAKSRNSLDISANRIWNEKLYDDIWSTDNEGIVDCSVFGEYIKTLNIRGLTPGIMTINWERCEGDMWAIKHIPVIVYESGSKNNPGDMNHDGVINAKDALEVLRYSVGLNSLDEKDKAVADLNQNHVVNAEDALLMLRISVGDK